jgi:hypothetical protein
MLVGTLEIPRVPRNDNEVGSVPVLDPSLRYYVPPYGGARMTARRE